jgi:DNA (cytosine-5)-methyltransferase 1
MLTVGSLFSGIGGLDLGLERAGMKVIWQSEIDPYCNKVLKKHWPEVPNYGNIKEIEWATIPRPDVICGGYPCQPFSTAGKRRGTDDPRHLWPWVRTAISELRPQYAILENVRGHLSMGGLQVIGELTEIGYDAEWRVVSAAGLGAPHRRDRIIIVAYPIDQRQQGWKVKSKPKSNRLGFDEAEHQRGPTNDERMAATKELADSKGSASGSTQPYDLCPPIWQTTKLRKSDSSTRTNSDWWQVEPDVGRVANGVSARVDRLRGLGNAVVPQLAEYIGRLVIAAELNNS